MSNTKTQTQTKTQTIENGFKLPNKVIKVVPIKRTRGKGGIITKDHVNNFLFGPAKKQYVAVIDNGNPLTREEQVFFEDPSKSGLHYKAGDLSHVKTENNFWLDFSNRVILGKTPSKLDLSKSDDYLKYVILRSNKEEFAMSPEILTSSDNKLSFKYVFQEEGYEDVSASNKYKKKKKIMDFMMKAENDKELMINFLSEYNPKMPVSMNTKDEFLISKIDRIGEEDPDGFIRIIEDANLNIKAIIRRGLRANAIKKDGQFYKLDNGETIGNGFDDAVKFLAKDENQEIRDRIEVLISKARM